MDRENYNIMAITNDITEEDVNTISMMKSENISSTLNKETGHVDNETAMERLLNTDIPEELIERTKEYERLMVQYKCAAMEVETKIKVLNEEFRSGHSRNPIENIKTRIKKPSAIAEKLGRKGVDISLENMEKYLSDVAGVRVICSYPEDVYNIADLIIKQDDIQIVAVKDYIRTPKENGYRSIHLIIEIPIFLVAEKRKMRVEVQIRTIAMDFWASLEHKLAYKQKNIESHIQISEELKKCADIISDVDYRLQDIRNWIEREE